jgi:hypothetical protein
VSGGTTPLPDNFLRPIKGYADIQLIETGGNSNYHSMQVQLNRRFSSSLSFGVSYTCRKQIFGPAPLVTSEARASSSDEGV